MNYDFRRTAFTAVCAFAAGALVMDVAQDWRAVELATAKARPAPPTERELALLCLHYRMTGQALKCRAG